MMQKDFPQKTQKQSPKKYRRFYALVCLSAVFFLGGCGASKVQTVKVEAEANQIIDILNEYGIKANKEEKGEANRREFDISVDGGDEERAAAIQIMEDHCLGQPEPAPIEGGAVITSTGVEKAREQQRIKINIESQLRHIPGATCVSVNFVPPEDRTIALNPYQATATVSIYYKTPTFPLNKDEIAAMVAPGIPALKPENVNVTLVQKPLRPLPDLHSGYKFTRLALVAGIGSATILTFVSIVFFLQKKRSRKLLSGGADELEVIDDENPSQPKSLLNSDGEFDEYDDDIEIN